MRPPMPAARKKARVKLVLPAPRSPRKWMRPPGGAAGRSPQSMGASCAASALVASSSGKYTLIVFKICLSSFMGMGHGVGPSVSHRGMVTAEISVPIDIVPATSRPSPPIRAART